MTKEELDEIIQEQKDEGFSEEDIAKKFAIAFKDGDITKDQLIELMAAVGYELSDEYKEMPDEELKAKILVQKDDEGITEEEKEKAETYPQGPDAPAAHKDDKKSDKKDEEEVEVEEKVEEKDDDEEYEKAMKAFGLR